MAKRVREISGDAPDVKWQGKKVDVIYIDADSLEDLWTEIFVQAAGLNIQHVDTFLIQNHLANRFHAAVIIDTKGTP